MKTGAEDPRISSCGTATDEPVDRHRDEETPGGREPPKEETLSFSWVRPLLARVSSAATTALPRKSSISVGANGRHCQAFTQAPRLLRSCVMKEMPS